MHFPKYGDIMKVAVPRSHRVDVRIAVCRQDNAALHRNTSKYKQHFKYVVGCRNVDKTKALQRLQK